MTDYTLTPENILGDLVAPRGRRMLDSHEIFRELVSQRLAQGFQLIDLGREQSECYRQMNKWVILCNVCCYLLAWYQMCAPSYNSSLP